MYCEDVKHGVHHKEQDGYEPRGEDPHCQAELLSFDLLTGGKPTMKKRKHEGIFLIRPEMTSDLLKVTAARGKNPIALMFNIKIRIFYFL